MSIDLTVVSLAGFLGTVRAESTWTVLDVKKALGIKTTQSFPVGNRVRRKRYAKLQQLNDSARLQPRVELCYGAKQLCNFESLENVLPAGEQSIELTLIKVAVSLCEWQASAHVFSTAPDIVREDPEVVSAVMKSNPRLFRYACGEARGNRELALAAVTCCGEFLQYVEGDACFDREVLLTALTPLGKRTRPGNAYMYVPKNFKSDREIMLAAIRGNESAFGIVDEKLQSERDFIFEAVEANWKVLRCMPEHVRSDRDIVLLALRISGDSPYEVLKFVSEELRGDRECIAVAVQGMGLRSASVLALASEEIRADHEIALDAVRSKHAEYMHVGDALREDYELLVVALQTAEAQASSFKVDDFIKCIASKFLTNPEIACMLVRTNSQSYQLLPKDARENMVVKEEFIRKRLHHPISHYPMRRNDQTEGLQNIFKLGFEAPITNRELVLEVATKFGSWLQLASEGLRMDREIVVTAVGNGLPLQDVHESLRLDLEVVVAAINYDSCVLKYILGLESCAKLLADREVALSVFRANAQNYKLLPQEVRNDEKLKEEFVKARMTSYAKRHRKHTKANAREGLQEIWASGFVPALTNREFVLEVVNNFGSWLQLADDDLRKDRDVAMSAVKNDGLALQYVHKSLHADHEIVMSAVKNDGLALQYVHNSFPWFSPAMANAEDNAVSLHFDIVVAAIAENPYAYRFAGHLKNDFTIISLVDKTCNEKQMSDKQIDKFFSIMARPLTLSPCDFPLEAENGEDKSQGLRKSRRRAKRR